MKKNTFIESAIILIIGGLITKILGLAIKILTIRFVGIEGTNLYMLILPTFSLFITIAQLGFPIAVSKLIGEERRDNKKIILSIIPVSLILNMVLMLIVFILSPYISRLLHEYKTLYPLISIALVLPFISISGIVRGYFFGKSRMMPHTVSHIAEQIIRLVLIIVLIPMLLKISIEIAVVGIVLINIVSELGSIIILIGSLPKKIKITRQDLRPDREIVKDIMNISIPTTSSRLIGSFAYFLEPIFLTFFLMLAGYSNKFIINEYGIINGYVLPLLMIPSFFTQAISSAVIPIISKGYVNNQMTYIKSKFKQVLLISVTIGVVVTIILMLAPELLLKMLFNTTRGVTYIKTLAPFFLLYYVQIPIIATLQAIDKACYLMSGAIIGSLIKLGTIIILSFLNIGMYPLIIAIIINIIIVTIYSFIKLKKAIN